MSAPVLLTYDPDRPWNRQPCDTEYSWPAFLVYRDMVRPRSLQALSNTLSQSVSTVRRWHDDHGWKLRVTAWDAQLDKRRQAVILDLLDEDARDRANRHMGLLRQLEDLATEGAREMLDRVDEGEKLRWTATELVRVTKMTIELQRLITGEPTENTKHTLDLGRLSVEELEVLRTLQLKAGGQQ